MENQHSEFTRGEDVYPGQFPAKVEDDNKIPTTNGMTFTLYVGNCRPRPAAN